LEKKNSFSSKVPILIFVEIFFSKEEIENIFKDLFQIQLSKLKLKRIIHTPDQEFKDNLEDKDFNLKQPR